MRRMLVAGNWKMHGSVAEAQARASAVAGWSWQHGGNIDIALFPPAPQLAAVVQSLTGSPVATGAQDVHGEVSGAFTGAVSAEMLVDVGCRFVIVGHSERRQQCGESDPVVAAKAMAGLRAGLTPIVCVGESLAERRAGAAEQVVAAQLAALVAVVGEGVERCVVAYEPVWAIGTGEVATPAMIGAIHSHIRLVLAAVNERARAVRILYGGSVKAANAGQLFAVADVDGGLIGGASLDAAEFLAICAAAKEAG